MKLSWFLSLLLPLASAVEDAPFTVQANDQLDVPRGALTKLMQLAQPVDPTGNSHARLLEDEYADNDNLSRYSIQFQGCHHIQQWNEDAQDEDDVRISTTRLVRFRLVPYRQCKTVSPWAAATAVEALRNSLGGVDYGEYIVDLNAFVESYIEAKEEECYYDSSCSDNMFVAGDDDGGNGIQIADYAQCAQFDFEFARHAY